VFRVSNTAFGAISFLVLEAIGGTITVNYGFINALLGHHGGRPDHLPDRSADQLLRRANTASTWIC
jgi:hypothetical protein